MKLKFFVVIGTVLTMTACTTPNLVSEPQTVQIYKSDSSVQCGGEGLTLEQMQDELQNITVLSMQKGSLNHMYPAVCGGATGQINIYTIYQKDLATAQQLGFEILTDERF